MSTDLDHLMVCLKQATRSAVTDLVAAFADERFYAISLYTDGDVVGIQFAANSEARLAETVARYRFRDARSIAGLRFSKGEWGYEGFGQEHFIPVGAFLSTLGQAHPDRKSFATLRERIHGLMIETLAALDSEVFFRRGPHRERLTLLCTVTDANRAGERFQDRSVRALNPPAVVAEYRATQKQATSSKYSGGPPCPHCGKPLRTAQARQCFLCGARWHGALDSGWSDGGGRGGVR